MNKWIADMQRQLWEFADERDWHQYHTIPNLVQSVAIEAGELLELVQWGKQPTRERLAEEIADVLIYVLRLADVAGVDIPQAVDAKIAENARRRVQGDKLIK
jgi:NTP pyrophosphatase (non-canonical NTP hydrolase)